MASIEAIVMPKWGLAMQEGTLVEWSVAEGDTIAAGQEILEIETSKITNVFESPVGGKLRRIVAGPGETLPVGALLGVVAEDSVDDAEIDAFVARFQAEFVPAEDAEEAGPEPRSVEAGGLRLQYLLAAPETPAPGAVPALLIHGFGADHQSWMFNHLTLGQARPAYAIDLPGHGGSAKQIPDASVAGLAAKVEELLAALELPAAHLVGHSLGGAVCLQLAHQAPERVASLTLIAPGGLGPEVNADFIEGFITEKRDRKLRAVLEQLVADKTLITADMIEQVKRYKRLDGAEAALRALAAANFAGGRQAAELRGALEGLDLPVQVIWGEADAVLPASHAEGLPERVRVTRLAETGHLPHMERSGEVNSLLAGFMAG